MTKTFEIGKTYSTRSACDYDTIFSWKVIGRTAKFVTLESRTWGVTRAGVRTWGDGIEHCSPRGRYSMAPVISADRFDA